MSEELKSIFSSEKELSLGGKIIKIKDVTIGDIPVFMEIINKLASKLTLEGTNLQVGLLISQAISSEFDSVLEILELTTDLSMEDIKKLNLAAATLIAHEVIKQNIDFLSKHALPALQKIKESLAGMKKSKSSSSPAIG